ncbi:neutral zinc metallopeptidase [Sinosporangium siamense]
MRKLPSLLAVTTVFTLMGAGTALAATPAADTTVRSSAAAGTAGSAAGNTVLAPPRGRAAAVANPLYRSGTLPVSSCAPTATRKGSAASFRLYAQKVHACLNTSWTAQFKKARIPFSRPNLRFVTSRITTPCGKWTKGATGVYCGTNRTVYIAITKSNLRDPFDLGLAQLVAHEYAHHVQYVAGILPYYWEQAARSRASVKLLLSRRSELQADCLAGAFLRSAQNRLPVDQDEWDGMIRWTQKNGHKGWPTNDHGKGTSQAYWMQRGFNAGSPSACNTWTAPSSRVS